MTNFLVKYFKNKRNTKKGKYKKEKNKIGVIYEKGNIPYLKVKIGNKQFYLMIDTGASTSVLDTSVLEYLRATDFPLCLLTSDKVVAGFGEEQEVQVYEVPILIEERLFFTNISFTNLSIIEHIKSEYSLDIKGVLGYDFFDKYNCILNFYNKKLYGLFSNKKSETI